jgi:glucose/arabinose dehydrogenase
MVLAQSKTVTTKTGKVQVETVARDDKVVSEDRVNVGARVRDVRQGPEGAVYVLTDERDGAILRLTPGQGD